MEVYWTATKAVDKFKHSTIVQSNTRHVSDPYWQPRRLLLRLP